MSKRKPGKPPIIRAAIPDDETIHMNVTLTGAEYNPLRDMCLTNGLVPSQVIRVAWRYYLRHAPGTEMLLEAAGTLDADA